MEGVKLFCATKPSRPPFLRVLMNNTGLSLYDEPLSPFFFLPCWRHKCDNFLPTLPPPPYLSLCPHYKEKSLAPTLSRLRRRRRRSTIGIYAKEVLGGREALYISNHIFWIFSLKKVSPIFYLLRNHALHDNYAGIAVFFFPQYADVALCRPDPQVF